MALQNGSERRRHTHPAPSPAPTIIIGAVEYTATFASMTEADATDQFREQYKDEVAKKSAMETDAVTIVSISAVAARRRLLDGRHLGIVIDSKVYFTDEEEQTQFAEVMQEDIVEFDAAFTATYGSVTVKNVVTVDPSPPPPSPSPPPLSPSPLPSPEVEEVDSSATALSYVLALVGAMFVPLL